MTTNASICSYCGQSLEPIVFKLGDSGILPLKHHYQKCNCPDAVKAKDLMEREAEKEKDHQAKLDAIKDREKKIDKSGIPKKFRNADADTEPWLPLIRERKSIFFHGKEGVGKTHLSCAIALALIDEIGCFFTTMGHITSEILSHKMTNEKLCQRLSKYDLLILDDLGKEKTSEWAVGLTYEVINFCYENMLPVIITSNYNMEGLTKRMTIGGDDTTVLSIVSRIYEMCDGPPVTLSGEDRRLNCAK